MENDLALKNADRNDYLTKGDHVFQKCDRVTEPENQKFLAKSVETIGADCGNEVYNNLTRDGSITKQCCKKLVKTGEKCHTNMGKALIRTPAMGNVDPNEFLEKNQKIFNDCKRTE